MFAGHIRVQSGPQVTCGPNIAQACSMFINQIINFRLTCRVLLLPDPLCSNHMMVYSKMRSAAVTTAEKMTAKVFGQRGSKSSWKKSVRLATET